MREIIIKCNSNEERNAIGGIIHEQLRGNEDYIASNIVLNIGGDREVGVYIGDEVMRVPAVCISFPSYERETGKDELLSGFSDWFSKKKKEKK